MFQVQISPEEGEEKAKKQMLVHDGKSVKVTL